MKRTTPLPKILIPGDNPFIRESLLQEKFGEKIRCNVCERRCVIIPKGLGWCQTRANRDGKLVTLIYSAVSSMSANPIEKKPFYHFLPGTAALTIGSWSCNFGCPWCQNWDISKEPPQFSGDFISPQEFIELIQVFGCQGTSISFNEPTLSLEWSLDVFRLAREKGFYNTYVTNGYMTPEALSLLIEAGLDAMNVDIKGEAEAVRKYCKGIDVKKVWENCKTAQSKGIHLEITTLIIPTVNDSSGILMDIAERIANELGPKTPWHVTGYSPSYQFNAPKTPISTLERAWELGKEAGLGYVYIGNIPGHRYTSTGCPKCGTLLIRRYGFFVTQNLLQNGHCPECGMAIAGIWGKK